MEKSVVLKDFTNWFVIKHREVGFNAYLSKKLPISIDGLNFIIPQIKDKKIEDKIVPRKMIEQSYYLTYEQVYMCTKNNVYANELYESMLNSSLSHIQKVLKTDGDRFRGTLMFDVVLNQSKVLHETPSGFEIKFQSDVIV
jgi:hypothetical protein